MRARPVCIDFDGTIVTHEYPKLGDDIPLALQTIKDLQKAGHKVILFTMRSGDTLEEAVQYLAANGITCFGVNENPEQASWSASRKVYGALYIDDAALGCPLRWPADGGRALVDWTEVRIHLIADGWLPPEGD